MGQTSCHRGAGCVARKAVKTKTGKSRLKAHNTSLQRLVRCKECFVLNRQRRSTGNICIACFQDHVQRHVSAVYPTEPFAREGTPLLLRAEIAAAETATEEITTAEITTAEITAAETAAAEIAAAE
jgi:hypothetical protein